MLCPGLLCPQIPVFLVEVGNQELKGANLVGADVLGRGQVLVFVVVARQLLLELSPSLQLSRHRGGPLSRAELSPLL